MRLSYIVNAISLMMMYISLVLLLPVLAAVITKDLNSVMPFISAAVLSAGLGYLMRELV